MRNKSLWLKPPEVMDFVSEVHRIFYEIDFTHVSAHILFRASLAGRASAEHMDAILLKAIMGEPA